MKIHSPQSLDSYVRPTNAATAQETGPRDPRDSFASSSQETAPEKPVRPANPGADWMLARRVAERQIALPELFKQAPQSALPWLGSSDPHLRAMASRKYGYLEGLSQGEKYLAQHGHLNGSAAQLNLSTMFVGKFRTVEAQKVDPALASLDDAVRAEGKATPRALRTMLSAVRNLQQHSRTAEVEDANRTVAAELATRATEVLNGWWRDGLCEVTGREPGSLDLTGLGKLAVRGNRLAEVHGPGGEADTIVSMNKPDLLVTMLNRNLAGGNELAGLLVQEVLSRCDEPAPIKLLAGLLEGCKDNPRLAAALRPHVAEMSRLGTASEALNGLGPDSRGGNSDAVSTCYRELITAFPEVVDERLLRQMAPLLFDTNAGAADAAGYVLKMMWEKKPALVGPSVKMVMRGVEESNAIPSGGVWRILGRAGEHGWEPDQLERDWMITWLNSGPDEAADRIALWNSGSFEPGLQALSSFVGRDPHFLDGQVMADRQGKLQRVPDALVDHLLGAPGSDKRFTCANETWPRHLFKLIAPEPDKALEQRLLEPIEADLRDCRKLVDLPADRRTRFAVLGSMSLSQAMREKLDGLLEKALPNDHEHLNGLVEPLRNARSDKLWQEFAHRSTSLDGRLEAAIKAYGLIAGLRGSGEFNRQTHAALNALEPDAADRLASELAQRFERQAARGLTLDQLGPEGVREIRLGSSMGRPELLESMRKLLPGRDSKLEGESLQTSHVLKARLRSQNDAWLAEKGHSEEQRLTWLDDCYQLADPQNPASSVKAWAENATGWVGETVGALGPVQGLRATRALMGQDEPGRLFFEVQDRLKAGKLFEEELEVEPVQVAQALEEIVALRAQGLEHSAALDRVLGKIELPGAVPSSGIEETPTHVGVGSVRLRRRS